MPQDGICSWPTISLAIYSCWKRTRKTNSSTPASAHLFVQGKDLAREHFNFLLLLPGLTFVSQPFVWAGWGLATAQQERLAMWVPYSAPQAERFTVMNTLWQCCPIYLAATQFSCNFCTTISMQLLYSHPICLQFRDRPHSKVLLTPAFAIINPSALTASRANTDYKTLFPL